MSSNKIIKITAWLLISSSMSCALAAETAPRESFSTLTLIIFLIIVAAVAVVTVTALTRWGRKQDEISSMLYFCIDFLVNTHNEAERYRAADLLGKTKNPEALLVLVDVINDESAEPGIRGAARDALLEMSENYHRYTDMIGGLLAASEADDHERTVELLKENFEQGERKLVQSAYVIGRELFRLQEYADAREWLRTADQRNRRYTMYVDQIRDYIEKSNRALFAEGDKAYEAGDFHLANERYALASQGLSNAKNKRFSYFIRAACVYCKLEEYENASEALLQALHHQHETNTALEMNKLVGALKDSAAAGTVDQNLVDELARFVDQTMDRLAAKVT